MIKLLNTNNLYIKLLTTLALLAFLFSHHLLKAKIANEDASLPQGQYKIKIAPIDVIASSLSLNYRNNFTTPAMESSIKFGFKDFGSLNDFNSIAKSEASLQVNGGPRSLAQSFSMRGVDKNGISVFVDGIPISFLSQHSNSLFINGSGIQSLDIIKGPFSSIYGSGAVGGVVAFQSISPESLLAKKGAGEDYGSNYGISFSSAQHLYTTAVTGYGRKQNVNFLINVSYDKAGNDHSGESNKIQMSQKVKKASSIIKTKINISDNQSAKFNYYYNHTDDTVPSNPEQNNTGIFMLKNINHRIMINHHVIKLEHMYVNDNIALPSFNTIVYYKYSLQKEDPSENFPGNRFYLKGQRLGKANVSYGLRHRENSYFKKIIPYTDDSLVYGLNYEAQDQSKLKSDPRGLIADAKSNNVDYFIQNQLFFTEYLSLKIAGNYDTFYIKNNNSNYLNQNKSYNQISPKTSLTILPTKSLMFYVSYGTAFRNPNINEVYASGLHFATPFGNNYLMPNYNLKPAKSNTMEVGYGINLLQNKNTLSGDFTFKSALYKTKVSNYIALSVGRSTSRYININSVSLEGIDTKLEYKNKLLLTKVTYNYIKALNQESEAYSTSLMNISAHTANLTYEQFVPSTGLSLKYNLRAQSSFKVCNSEPGLGDYSCSLGQKAMPGFVTHDLYINYNDDEYEFSVGIENLLDKFYYNTFAALPSSGRSYVASFIVKF